MTSPADRGKFAEGEVRKYLQAQVAKGPTAFLRLPDAHAGSRTETICDFLVCSSGRPILIEVKEVDHASRLPHKNFDVGQVARMRLWEIAGAKAVVCIYFKPIQAWRILPLSLFIERTGGSWQLADYSTQPTLEGLLP